ncbi:MAG: hypothetical protein ABR592_03000 [Nitriliruptorales bacterium]
MRAEVSEELVLVRLLLDVGHVEAAKRLIDERSARLRHFQDHVEAAIASAVVERTAEEILAAAAEAPDSPDRTTRCPAVEGGREAATARAKRVVTEGTARPYLRPLVAAASLVILVALFVTGGPLPGLYELVSGESNSSPHSQRGGAPGGDRKVTAGDDGASEADDALPDPAGGVLDHSAEPPEILLLLGRLARFAEGTGNGPVAALLDVDRLVARLVTEVAPLLAPLPADLPQGEATSPPQHPAQPNAAPQPQPNSQQPPSSGGEPVDQTQPGGPPSPDAPLVNQQAPRIDEGAEGDSMEERWRKRREQGGTEQAPDIPDELAPRD